MGLLRNFLIFWIRMRRKAAPRRRLMMTKLMTSCEGSGICVDVGI